MNWFRYLTLREKYPYSEFLWSVCSRICTEYSVQMRKNVDQKNCEYGHVSRSIKFTQTGFPHLFSLLRKYYL